MGGALGLAILAAVANAAVSPGARPNVGVLNAGFQDAFLVGAGFAFLGAITATVLVRGEDSRAMVGAEPAAVPAA
ncbi:MAG: hypothetical protein H0T15_08550 [Thermoleophilaceae bacterium]|nr:hypothetical protein [Thermoleophilaceae bacterium]